MDRTPKTMVVTKRRAVTRPPPGPPRAVATPTSAAARRLLHYVALDNICFFDDADIDVAEAVAYAEELYEDGDQDADELPLEFGAVVEDGSLAILLLADPQVFDPVLLVLAPDAWLWAWEGQGTRQALPACDQPYSAPLVMPSLPAADARDIAARARQLAFIPPPDDSDD